MRLLRTVTIVLLFATGTRTAAAQGHSQDRGHKGERGKGDERGSRGGQGEHVATVPAMEQRQRVQIQQQRAAEYRRQLDQQVIAMQQQNVQLQQQRRMSQYGAQLQYAAQLRQQQHDLLAARDYATDPWVSAPYTYRYVANGANRQTNQYGAEVLRQAVRNGYAQGYRAGQADQQDHSPASYQSTFAYRDANHGYAGRDVEQSDYNFYFRQGLERGYADGFAHRAQYGTVAKGAATIHDALLSTILGLQPIR